MQIEKTAYNTDLAKVAVQCSVDTFVVNQSLVLCINICGENRHLHQARNRYGQGYETPKRKQSDKKTTIKSGLQNTMETSDHIKRGDITKPNK